MLAYPKTAGAKTCASFSTTNQSEIFPEGHIIFPLFKKYFYETLWTNYSFIDIFGILCCLMHTNKETCLTLGRFALYLYISNVIFYPFSFSDQMLANADWLFSIRVLILYHDLEFCQCFIILKDFNETFLLNGLILE